VTTSNAAIFASATQYYNTCLSASTSNTTNQDTWLTLQLYRLSVLEYQGITAMYVAFVKRQRKVAENVIARVLALLKNAVDQFSTHLSLAWLEPIAFLKEIADSYNGAEPVDEDDTTREDSDSIRPSTIDIYDKVIEASERIDNPMHSSSREDGGAGGSSIANTSASGDDGDQLAHAFADMALTVGLSFEPEFDTLNIRSSIVKAGRIKYCIPRASG
jgi:hypothetical protein